MTNELQNKRNFLISFFDNFIDFRKFLLRSYRMFSNAIFPLKIPRYSNITEELVIPHYFSCKKAQLRKQSFKISDLFLALETFK